MIISLILLLGKGKLEINLLLTGIALGLIIDEFTFILSKTRGAVQYSSTLPSTIIIALVFILSILSTKIIYQYFKKHK
jgi:hypothetical protein